MRTRPHATDCYRRMLCEQPHALRCLDDSATILQCECGQQIPIDSERDGRWYYIISGAVRRSTIRRDGRRQIVELMLPRDFFFLSREEDEGSIEAMGGQTVLASYSGSKVELLAERDRKFARELREIASQSLLRTRNQLLILGGITAAEKVGSFLASLDGRISGGKGHVHLPFTRYDMAEYLAISVETVCRAISDLQHRGIIALVGTRTIKILDRRALEDRVGKRLQDEKSRLIAA